MRILSATEAISPAFSRTKLVLFSPFQFWRTWKIGITGYLTVMSAVFVPWPLMYLLFLPAFTHRAGGKGMAAFLIGGVVIGLAIYLALFFLLTKLRFAFFGMVLNREPMVRPMWRLYGQATMRWSLFKIAIGTAVTLVFSWPLVSFGKHFFHVMSAMQVQPGQPPSPQMFQAMMAFYAAFFVMYFAFGILMWLGSLITDFVVPSLALEDVPLKEAFRRTGLLIKNEPGQVTGYAFLKLLLAFGGAIAAGTTFYIVILIVIVVAIIVGGIIGLLLHLMHVPSNVLWVFAMIAAFLVYLFSIFYFMAIANGIVITFLESYLLYFLGGRYPMLGDLLEGSTPPPAVVPPIYAYSPTTAWPPQPPPQ